MSKRDVSRSISFLKTWRNELAKEVGPEHAAALIKTTQEQYDSLVSQIEPPQNKALRRHLHDVILPGLALYRALINAGHCRQEALDTELRLFQAILKRRRKMMKAMSRLPFAFSLFKGVTMRSMKNMFPPEGWDVTWPDEGPDCLAFDMSRCYYLMITEKFNARELMPVFCDCGDFMFEALAPKLIWQRTSTLGRGGQVCDFRFYRGPVHRDKS